MEDAGRVTEPVPSEEEEAEPDDDEEEEERPPLPFPPPEYGLEAADIPSAGEAYPIAFFSHGPAGPLGTVAGVEEEEEENDAREAVAVWPSPEGGGVSSRHQRCGGVWVDGNGAATVPATGEAVWDVPLSHGRRSSRRSSQETGGMGEREGGGEAVAVVGSAAEGAWVEGNAKDEGNDVAGWGRKGGDAVGGMVVAPSLAVEGEEEVEGSRGSECASSKGCSGGQCVWDGAGRKRGAGEENRCGKEETEEEQKAYNEGVGVGVAHGEWGASSLWGCSSGSVGRRRRGVASSFFSVSEEGSASISAQEGRRLMSGAWGVPSFSSTRGGGGGGGWPSGSPYDNPPPAVVCMGGAVEGSAPVGGRRKNGNTPSPSPLPLAAAAAIASARHCG